MSKGTNEISKETTQVGSARILQTKGVEMKTQIEPQSILSKMKVIKEGGYQAFEGMSKHQTPIPKEKIQMKQLEIKTKIFERLQE